MQRFMLPSVQTVECVKPAPNIYISLLQDIILHCGSCNGYHQAGQGFTVATTAALHRTVQCQCTTSCYAVIQWMLSSSPESNLTSSSSNWGKNIYIIHMGSCIGYYTAGFLFILFIEISDEESTKIHAQSHCLSKILVKSW